VGVGGGSMETRVELEAMMDEALVDELSTTILGVTMEDEIVAVFDRLDVNEKDEIVCVIDMIGVNEEDDITSVIDMLGVNEEDEIVSVVDMLDGVENPYETKDVVVVGKNGELDKDGPFPDGEEIELGELDEAVV